MTPDQIAEVLLIATSHGLRPFPNESDEQAARRFLHDPEVARLLPPDLARLRTEYTLSPTSGDIELGTGRNGQPLNPAISPVFLGPPFDEGFTLGPVSGDIPGGRREGMGRAPQMLSGRPQQGPDLPTAGYSPPPGGPPVRADVQEAAPTRQPYIMPAGAVLPPAPDRPLSFPSRTFEASQSAPALRLGRGPTGPLGPTGRPSGNLPTPPTIEAAAAGKAKEKDPNPLVESLTSLGAQRQAGTISDRQYWDAVAETALFSYAGFDDVNDALGYGRTQAIAFLKEANDQVNANKPPKVAAGDPYAGVREARAQAGFEREGVWRAEDIARQSAQRVEDREDRIQQHMDALTQHFTSLVASGAKNYIPQGSDYIGGNIANAIYAGMAADLGVPWEPTRGVPVPTGAELAAGIQSAPNLMSALAGMGR